jgi:hypothetical protein
VTGFKRLVLVRAAIGALALASSASALAEARPPIIGERPQSVGVVLFRVLVREYLEFRVGSQVTIRSNAGRVVITASAPRTPGNDSANAQGIDESAAQEALPRSSAQPLAKASMPAAAVIAEADKRGATNVCLYVEGAAPSCGDLSEVAGRVVYTASNP